MSGRNQNVQCWGRTCLLVSSSNTDQCHRQRYGDSQVSQAPGPLLQTVRIHRIGTCEKANKHAATIDWVK
jgi:hypothetical protein